LLQTSSNLLREALVESWWEEDGEGDLREEAVEVGVVVVVVVAAWGWSSY